MGAKGLCAAPCTGEASEPGLTGCGTKLKSKLLN